MRVALGGTFDILHDGHRALLAAAFALGPQEVLIGLTTDRFARETRAEVNPYEVRKTNLVRFLRRRGRCAFRIEPIDDPFGPADDLPDLDALVVSSDRAKVAAALNEARAARGLRPLEVHRVPMILAQDGLPIQSRRIREGLIDAHGHRLKPVRVHVGTDNPVKVRAVRRVFASLSIRARVRAVSVPRDVPEQPFEHDALRGAVHRARSAIQDGDFGVGIEAGLIMQPALGERFDVQYAAVVDRSGRVTVGHGPGFAYPPAVLEKVLAGKTVGEAMSELAGIKDIGTKQGAIGFLTKRRLDREELTESAVLMAMVPRIRPELYFP